MLCGHFAVFMSAGVSSGVDCGSWVAAVRACAAGLLRVHVMWCLWSFLLEVAFCGGAFLGDGECDGRSWGGGGGGGSYF